LKDIVPTNIGFLASGRGSNVRAIVDACRNGCIDASPAVIISTNAMSGVLEYAKNENIPHYHLSQQTHPNSDVAITETLIQHDVSLVVLAGYMKKIGPHLLKTFKNRIINIHPSLLPKFGGKGMYGIKVHEAVLAAGEKETGVSIHLVNDEYDQGQILTQQKVSVEPNDTPESLAARVLAIEHELYKSTIHKIISGKLVLPTS
jgi:phosphoribosylglycinamide formyltransferase-1